MNRVIPPSFIPPLDDVEGVSVLAVRWALAQIIAHVYLNVAISNPQTYVQDLVVETQIIVPLRRNLKGVGVLGFRFLNIC